MIRPVKKVAIREAELETEINTDAEVAAALDQQQTHKAMLAQAANTALPEDTEESMETATSTPKIK